MHTKTYRGSQTVKSQFKTFTAAYRDFQTITATVRWDDECGNGHNSFSITGETPDSGGCIHGEIAAHFPQLAHLIRWHLFDAFGPMHYVANTVWHAGDQDHNGLRKGEKKQLRAGGKTPVWERVCRNDKGEVVNISGSGSNWFYSETQPPDENLVVRWEPVWTVGEGKERNLKAARNVAVWPDATDAELTEPGLEDRLLARLPKLMAEFRADVKKLGFTW